MAHDAQEVVACGDGVVGARALEREILVRFLAFDREKRDVLRTLSTPARQHLRNVLIRDQADRVAISSRLMRSTTRTVRTGPT